MTDEQNSPRHHPRLDTVDLLRGFSILAVVLLHISIRVRIANLAEPAMPDWLRQLLFRNGDNGVTVFFAVSGFLITLTSLRRFGTLAGMRPRRFYRIRFARIAPLLFLLLAILSLLHLSGAPGFVISPERGTLPGALFSALTFHLNWYEAVHGYLPANWDILWSLSVEEMFYLAFPLLCASLLVRGASRWVFYAILAALILMGPFARTVWTAKPIWQEKTYLGGTDAIAMGCLCALLTDRFLRERRRLDRAGLIACEIVGWGLLFWIAVWPAWPIMRTIGRTGLDGSILAVGTCLVMFASVLRGADGARWLAPLRWFGRHSYEVYLTHEFVVVWGTMLYVRLRSGPIGWWYLGMLLATAPLGAVAAGYFSEPLNRRLRGNDRSGAALLTAAGSGGTKPRVDVNANQ